MSTATLTNGAVTEAAFKAIAGATTAATTAASKVVDASSSLAPSLDRAMQAGQDWFADTKRLAIQSLDAFDAGMQAYLELTKSAAAAAKALDWAMELTQSNAKILSEWAANYSNVARDLLDK
jgi:hypothetical protein